MSKKIIMGTMPRSSSLARVGFDGEKDGPPGTLRVEFKDGSTVDHANVPYAVYRGLVLSRSAGQYYNEKIRNKF